jgi:hypothetical protein
MKKALYHFEGGRAELLDVLKQHDDGTVDLGLNGEAKVTRCAVLAEPKVGQATKAPEAAPAKREKEEPKDEPKDEDPKDKEPAKEKYAKPKPAAKDKGAGK